MVAKGPGVKFIMAQYPDLFIMHFSMHVRTKFCAFITKCTIVATFYAMPPH